MNNVGRPLKPTALKLLEGEKNKDRINTNEPKPEQIIPECPKWLNKQAKEEWNKKSKELFEMGVLTNVDDTFLALYCFMVSIVIDCKNIIDEAGGIKKYTEGKNSQTTPELSMMWKAIENIKSFGATFGMSPGSRARLTVQDLSDEDDDFGDLLDG